MNWERVGITLSLFFLLTSCRSSPSNWCYQKICSPCPQYQAAKLSSKKLNPCDHLSLEIMRDNCERRVYLNVDSICFPTINEDKALTRVAMSTRHEEEEFLAHHLSGGQRLLIPEPQASRIVNYLKNGETITLSVGRYRETISPVGFTHHQKKSFFCN